MTLHRYSARRDANETALIGFLEQLGFQVTRLSGTGVPDLLLSRRQMWHVAEVKMPEGRHRPRQREFRDRHRAPVATLVTATDCLNLSDSVP